MAKILPSLKLVDNPNPIPDNDRDMVYLEIDGTTLPTEDNIRAKHDKIREVFAFLKDLKADFEASYNAYLDRKAAAGTLDQLAYTLLHYRNGHFPANAIRRYGYRAGVNIGVRTAKAKRSTGSRLTV